MRITELQKEDLVDVCKLNIAEYWKDKEHWRAASQENRWEIASWWGDPELLSWHYSTLQASNGGILGLYQGSQLVAELDYVRTHEVHSGRVFERYHIIWVLVHPNHRRQGYAKQLLITFRSTRTHPTWIEPEDHRSANLYDKLGKVHHYLTNWVTHKRIYMTGRGEVVPEDRLMTAYKNGWIHLMGNYYATEYDLQQLLHAGLAEKYIWGNTEGPLVHHYVIDEIECFALITQYPRIFCSKRPEFATCRVLLKSIISDIFHQGFPSVYFQFKKDGMLEHVLSELGSECRIEKDPVYSLN